MRTLEQDENHSCFGRSVTCNAAHMQIVTLVVWCAGRFFLYTSYYSIFGALFGFTNFGRMMAIDNAVNGLFGLMQLPLTNWGIHGLGGNFTAINLLQVGRPCTQSTQQGPRGPC